MSGLCVTLTYPPSANRLWRAVNGRNIKSAEYRAWLSRPFEARSLSGRQIVGPYRMTLTADRPDKRRRDLSNLCKPVEDALQAAGLIRDDCDAIEIRLLWGDLRKPALVRVHLEAA